MSNYVSVSEYARINKKDPGNIRRLLAEGRLKGKKIGNQWVVSSSMPYPDDKRITSGKYIDWRKRTMLNKNKELMKNISEMINSLRLIYNDQIDRVVLYGSYARGQQTSESDVDIALIISNKSDKKTQDSMINCVADYELKCGKVLSVIEIDSEKYNYWRDTIPFYQNIDKEGIILWKAAA